MKYYSLYDYFLNRCKQFKSIDQIASIIENYFTRVDCPEQISQYVYIIAYHILGRILNLTGIHGKIKIIGGTYGDVYVGEIHSSQFTIAIKKYKEKFDYVNDDFKIFREIAILKTLNHPNIIPLLKYKNREAIFPRVYTNLYKFLSRLKSKIVSPDVSYHIINAVKYIMFKILLAFEYLSFHEIAHRDIKPHNILVTADGEPILADFGAARSCAILSNRMSGGVCTLWWSSPELILNLPHDTRSDIWSLGILFCDMFKIIHKLPETLQVDSTQKYLKKIKTIYGIPERQILNYKKAKSIEYFTINKKWYETSRQVLFTADVPVDMQEMIISMIHFNPNDRATAAQLLSLPLFNCYTHTNYLERFVFHYNNPLMFVGSSITKKMTLDEYMQYIKYFKNSLIKASYTSKDDRHIIISSVYIFNYMIENICQFDDDLPEKIKKHINIAIEAAESMHTTDDSAIKNDSVEQLYKVAGFPTVIDFIEKISNYSMWKLFLIISSFPYYTDSSVYAMNLLEFANEFSFSSSKIVTLITDIQDKSTTAKELFNSIL